MNIDEQRAGFLGRVRETWRVTLGNFVTTEGETRSLFNRLTELGALSREEASRLARDVRGRIEANRREVDARIESTLDVSVRRLSVPSVEECQELAVTLDSVTERLIELERRL